MTPAQVTVSTVANVSLALHFDGAQLGANATNTVAGLRAALANLALGYRPNLIEVAPSAPGGGGDAGGGAGSSGGGAGSGGGKQKGRGRDAGGRRLLWGGGREAKEALEAGLELAGFEFSSGWKARAAAWRAAVARLLAQAGAGDPHDGGWDEDAYAAYTQVRRPRRRGRRRAAVAAAARWGHWWQPCGLAGLLHRRPLAALALLTCPSPPDPLYARPHSTRPPADAHERVDADERDAAQLRGPGCGPGAAECAGKGCGAGAEGQWRLRLLRAPAAAQLLPARCAAAPA
jgi:hypothetical protein